VKLERGKSFGGIVTMKFTRVDATISTNKLIESKEFYMDHFGFQLVYESDWYIELVGTEIPASAGSGRIF